MKDKQAPFLTRLRDKRYVPVLWLLVSLLIALLSGIILFAGGSLEKLTSAIISVGLDPQRSQFIAALLLTLVAALLGAMLGRRKIGALLGSLLVFGLGYVAGFVQQQVRPVFGPGGYLEPLNSGILVRNVLIILALGLLAAFIGSTVGAAFAEVALDPPYRLIRNLWQRLVFKRSADTLSGPETQPGTPVSRRAAPGPARWLTAGVMLATVVLAANSGDLFIFSPDVNVHTKPQFKDNGGEVLSSTVLPDSFISHSLKDQRRVFQVYLPPSYNTKEGRSRHYPTLYLLHGSPGKVIDWITGGKANESADALIAAHRIPELIMIMPDGNGRPGQTPEWGNSADQQQMMENYVALDLVRYVDQHYRTIAKPEYRAIGGLSEGGFGAMNIAIHHPDIFTSVISLGGYYQAEGTVWGRNAGYRQANSPIYTIQSVQQAWKLHIYLGSANKDQPYYRYTLEFMQQLDKLHIPYRFDLEKGYHSWRIWQDQMYRAIAWIPWDNNTGTSANPKLAHP